MSDGARLRARKTVNNDICGCSDDPMFAKPRQAIDKIHRSKFSLGWEGHIVKKNWSYYTTSVAHKDKKYSSHEHLNEMGSKGWELVSVVAHADDGISVFYWKQQNLSIHEHESDFEIEPVLESQSDINILVPDEPEPQEDTTKPFEPAKIAFEIGDQIPDFKLRSTDGTYFSTSNLTKKTVLYFYPADGTEYCTIQAKGFSAVYETMTDMGLDIIGISPDDIEAHNRFKNDEGIPFHLLYDEASSVCSTFGLLQNPPPDDRYPMRTTFLIDTDKIILGLWNDVDVSTHSDDVVSFVLDVLEKAN